MSKVAGVAVRHTRLVLVIAAIIVTLGAIYGAGVANRLSPVGLEEQSSESGQANALLVRATGNEALPGFVALLSLGAHVKEPTTGAGKKVLLEGLTAGLKIHQLEQVIRADPQVGEVHSALDAGSTFVSRDGSLTYIAVQFRSGSERYRVEAARDLASRLAHRPEVKVGGSDLGTLQATNVIQHDTRRAELIAFPILFLLSLWFFRGLVAAALPLILGGSAIVLTQAGLRLATHVVSVSAPVLSVITVLGLGLAIDYSLLIVSRFREELACSSGEVAPALSRTMATAGRTVLFSASTVIVTLAALLVLPQQYFYSMGLGGALVTLLVCIAALTVLPALLALLGPRIDALAPARLQRSSRVLSRPVMDGNWYRFAQLVMRRPLTVAVVAAGVLIALGLPGLGVKFNGQEASTLPATASVRQVSHTLNSSFKLDPDHTTLVVTVNAPKRTLSDYRHTLRGLPGVSTVTPAQHVSHNISVVYVASKGGASSEGAQQLVRRIRGLHPGFETKVTGPTAAFVDLKRSLARHVLRVALLVALATLLAIFMLTGSVILPIKTLLMNSLTVTATIGILVLVFQDGHLHGLLGNASSGTIEIMQPVLLIAVLFGLSTDYGVFLLDRIREVHSSGTSNAEAIALGLERTGRITTTAALLLCVAIGSLLTSRMVDVREVSLGMAVGVLLDATIVRTLLVPSLMRLLDEANWWAPAPLRRIHDRFNASPQLATAAYSQADSRPDTPGGSAGALAGEHEPSSASQHIH